MKKNKRPKFKSDEEFRDWAIKQVEKDIRKNKYPCVVGHISKVYVGGCEWCDNTTRRIHISVNPTSSAQFTRGHCNSGQYTIHEDPNFTSQSEWFVCGTCVNS